MNRNMVWIFVVSCVVNQVAVAYEVGTHENLSEAALVRSDIVATSDLLSDLGLKAYSSGELFTDPEDNRFKIAIKELVRNGAKFEDNGLRPPNHFYDPVNNRPLTVAGTALGRTSPDWALEDGGDVTAPITGIEQAYSYKEAMQYFYEALTKHTEAERNASWGQMFQTLGQVIHHVQDMAQPEHVRNDQHLTHVDDSYYESYTDEPKNKAQIASLMSASKYPIPRFTTTRQFWTTSDYKGIANFTNRNFFSKDSIGDYTNPALKLNPNTVDIVDLLGADGQTLCNALKSQFNGAIPASACYVDFVRTDVIDDYTGGAIVENDRAASYSVFDAKLKQYDLNYLFEYTDGQVAQLKYLPTLNRFNFDAAHDYLIPRAVAYSAGLINHFFRGRLQISLPDAGIYGFMDHSTVPSLDVENGFEGFDTIKLKVTNVTPALPGQSIPETMNDGALVAVIKFHRNTCWQDDLSGNAPHVTIAPDPNGNSCRSPVEEIVVADEPQAISTANALTANAQEFTFRFTTNQLPLNAIDVYLQVVYRGQLGNEADVVVVGTKDISEPSFLTILNSSDYLATEKQSFNAYVISELNHAQLTEILDDLSLQIGQSRNDYCIGGPISALYWIDGACIPSEEPNIRIYDKYTINMGLQAPIKITLDGLPQQQHATLAFLTDKDAEVTLDNTGLNEPWYPPLPIQPYQDVTYPHVYCGYEYPSTCLLKVNQVQFGPGDVMPPTPFGVARNVYGTGPVLNVFYSDGYILHADNFVIGGTVYLTEHPAVELSGAYQLIDYQMNPVPASSPFAVTIEDWQ